MRLNREEGLKNLSQVVLDHAFVEGKPFSFKDHEYQIEIMNDTRQRIGVRKCSQVGLSELMVQKTLAMMTVLPNIRIIFTLPTKEMANEFSKDRFDGAIMNSDHYTSMVRAGDNSAGQKRIADSLLYIRGTFGAKAAISIPAEVLMSDELDFSNEAVIGKLNSRIRHAQTEDEMGNRGYRYRFSTPTVHGFGIDLDFNAGDQRYYMCKCEHCETWVLPDFATDLIVPGFDDKMINFGREHLHSERIDITQAWMKCPTCSKNLWSSLVNPARRSWVAKKPETFDRSYQVSPWDVPKYNTPPAIMKQVADYPLKSDFYNFVIGLPHSDNENTFNTEQAHKDRFCTVAMWIFMNCVVLAPTVGGMDVGKTLHLTVKTKVSGGWHTIWMEKIRNTPEDPAAGKIIDRYDFYRMRKLCIDAGPDITLVNTLVVAREGIKAVVYVQMNRTVIPVEEKACGTVINADRTKTLKLLLEAHNAGNMWYPYNDELRDELYKHLKTTKKIREKNADGDWFERFVKSDDNDHWVHSLNYANIAGLVCDMLTPDEEHHAPPEVGKVKVGSTAPKSDRKQDGHLLGLFGVGKASSIKKR
jgi:hypothetical protein